MRDDKPGVECRKILAKYRVIRFGGYILSHIINMIIKCEKSVIVYNYKSRG